MRYPPELLMQRRLLVSKNSKQTSPKVASQASKIFRDPKATIAEKSVTASDLAQASDKSKKK
jgi:hypothetical protein